VSVFFREGHKVMWRIDFDLANYGSHGKTSVSIMKKEPG
jgi:hypothetical protein